MVYNYAACRQCAQTWILFFTLTLRFQVPDLLTYEYIYTCYMYNLPQETSNGVLQQQVFDLMEEFLVVGRVG